MEEEVFGIIYKATNKINGRMYIGQTIRSLERRKYMHINDALSKRNNMYFHKAIRKYGVDNFDWEIVTKCNSLEELNKVEIEMIKKYNTFENGYNLNVGGNGNAGFKPTGETKKRMSRSLSGKKHHFYGKHLSKEHRKKLSESHKGKLVGSKSPYAKKYTVITPKGKKIFVHGIAEFCRNYKKEKLNFGNLIEVAKGKRKHHKDYKCKRLYEEVIICQK